MSDLTDERWMAIEIERLQASFDHRNEAFINCCKVKLELEDRIAELEAESEARRVECTQHWRECQTLKERLRKLGYDEWKDNELEDAR